MNTDRLQRAVSNLKASERSGVVPLVQLLELFDTTAEYIRIENGLDILQMDEYSQNVRYSRRLAEMRGEDITFPRYPKFRQVKWNQGDTATHTRGSRPAQSGRTDAGALRIVRRAPAIRPRPNWMHLHELHGIAREHRRRTRGEKPRRRP
jgi:hypothetical protein